MKKIALLFSPGLDSFLSNWMMSSDDDVDIERIYFNIGSRYSQYEIEFLRRVYPKNFVQIHSMCNLGSLEDEKAFVPNRNAVLACMAQAITNADTVVLNATMDDRVSDGSIDFRKSLSETLSISCGKKVLVTSFLEQKEKSDWVKLFSDKCPERRLELLNKTFSCYNKTLYEEDNLPYFEKQGNEYVEVGKTTVYGCGECVACYRRLCSLTAAGIFVPFYDFGIVEKYVNNTTIDPSVYPCRYKTIQDYHNFMRWFGCD